MAEFKGHRSDTTRTDLLSENRGVVTVTKAADPATVTAKEAPVISKTTTTYAEPVPADLSSLKLEVFQNNLAHSLSIINNEVMKGYVADISELELIVPDKKASKALGEMQFFRITELVYEKDEFAVHKFSTVLHTLSQKPCTVAMMIRSDGTTNDFYLGVRSRNKRYATGTMRTMFKNSLLGMFPGSRIEEYMSEDLDRELSRIGKETNAVSGVTCIADYKHNDQAVHNEDFIQGLEKFVRSMSGKRFTTIIIADSIGKGEIETVKREYEGICSRLSPFANMQVNFSETDSTAKGTSESRGKTTTDTYSFNKSTNTTRSTSIADTDGTNSSLTSSDSEGKSTSESDGTTKTNTVTDGTSKSHTTTATAGGFAGVPGLGGSASVSHGVTTGTNHSVSTSDAISKTLTHGLSSMHTDGRTEGISRSTTRTEGVSEGNTEGYGRSVGDALSIINADTYTDTFGSSKGITLNVKNITLTSELDRLEKQLKRIEESESFGMWRCAAYFMGEIPAVADTAANVYYSIISGDRSRIETSAVHSWNYGIQNVGDLKEYILNFLHPQFLYRGFDYDGDRLISVDPASMVNTNELAIHMGLPRHSIKGLSVVEHASFAQEIIPADREYRSDRRIHLGSIYHLGETTDIPLDLDLKSLSMHTLVTGSTGSGKSTAVYRLLRELGKNNIPFLVVEPAKGEYKDEFTDIKCFGTNPKIGQMIRINPFSFPENIHVLEHIDRLIEIINVCWPMYAAMPAVLKSSVEQAYKNAGWDMLNSENKTGYRLFPTFEDVIQALTKQLRNSEYSDDTKGDYIGALKTRLMSLTSGINGQIFSGTETDPAELFDDSAILDISRIGSAETKALIMGITVLKLQEYRTANANGANAALRHITVLEEAHNILKKTSTEQSMESSNMQGKSVEMLTNTIAEIRTYGEGFIIVDQAPDLLDTAAVRNTNTKIVFKLPEERDRIVAGHSEGLSDEQITELAKLPTGVAAVYQNNWREALLCKVAMPARPKKKREIVYDLTDGKKNIDRVMRELLKCFGKDRAYTRPDDICRVKALTAALNVPAGIRAEIIANLDSGNPRLEWAIADLTASAYNLLYVFEGTQKLPVETVGDLEQIKDIAVNNMMADDFAGFNADECEKILYFISEHFFEKYPDRTVFRDLCLDVLKGRVL